MSLARRCLHCGQYMHTSNLVIDTYPVTVHLYCSCGLVLDEREGAKTKVCFQSKLPQEEKDRIQAVLDETN